MYSVGLACDRASESILGPDMLASLAVSDVAWTISIKPGVFSDGFQLSPYQQISGAAIGSHGGFWDSFLQSLRHMKHWYM